MRVIGVNTLVDFGRQYADAEKGMSAWLAEARAAEWRTPQDIKNRYQHASFLSANRVVFNIKGNSYRLLVRMNYANRLVRIERTGTHAEYQRWKL